MTETTKTNRREFLQKGALIATATAIAASSANAQSPDFMTVSARTRDRCATCAYWGGQRTLSEDRRTVEVRSFGVCNNQSSPMYRTTTSAEHGPMDVWVKWPALD